MNPERSEGSLVAPRRTCGDSRRWHVRLGATKDASLRSAWILVLLLAAACASAPKSRPADIAARVTHVDAADRRIDLDSGQSVYWLNRTEVLWHGRTYNALDLEPGDEVSIHGYSENGRTIARTITVVHNVRS